MDRKIRFTLTILGMFTLICLSNMHVTTTEAQTTISSDQELVLREYGDWAWRVVDDGTIYHASNCWDGGETASLQLYDITTEDNQTLEQIANDPDACDAAYWRFVADDAGVFYLTETHWMFRSSDDLSTPIEVTAHSGRNTIGQGVFLTDNDLYYVSKRALGGWAINRVDRDGGTPQVVTTSEINYQTRIAVSAIAFFGQILITVPNMWISINVHRIRSLRRCVVRGMSGRSVIIKVISSLLNRN